MFPESHGVLPPGTGIILEVRFPSVWRKIEQPEVGARRRWISFIQCPNGHIIYNYRFPILPEFIFPHLVNAIYYKPEKTRAKHVNYMYNPHIYLVNMFQIKLENGNSGNFGTPFKIQELFIICTKHIITKEMCF